MNYLEVLAVAISVVTFSGGIVAWYRGAVEKRYAAERDFNHLKNNYDQINSNLLRIAKDQEEMIEGIEKDLIEVKNLLNLLIVHSTGGSASEIWRKVCNMDRD